MSMVFYRQLNIISPSPPVSHFWVLRLQDKNFGFHHFLHWFMQLIILLWLKYPNYLVILLHRSSHRLQFPVHYNLKRIENFSQPERVYRGIIPVIDVYFFLILNKLIFDNWFFENILSHLTIICKIDYSIFNLNLSGTIRNVIRI